jgi:hypothetical protein
VSWFNHHRLLEPLGYIPPAEAEAEAEANYDKQLRSQAVPAWLTLIGLHESRGGSQLFQILATDSQMLICG